MACAARTGKKADKSQEPWVWSRSAPDGLCGHGQVPPLPLYTGVGGWRETISEALPALRAELKSSMLLWGVHLQGSPSKAWQGVEGGQNCAQAEAPQD